MSKFLIGGLAVVFIVGVVSFFILSNDKKESPSEIVEISEEINTKPVVNEESDVPSFDTYKGKVLAGKNSKYIEFNLEDYKKAKSEGKIIFLDFYANWCPICRAEFLEILSGFNELSSDDVVGFRVNFNDSETDEAEKALAKEFKIPYQHTKVILVDGKVVLKDGDSWDKETFLNEIGKITN